MNIDTLNSRTGLLKSFPYKKYDFHNTSTRHTEQALFLISIFCITMYLFDAFYLWPLLILPIIIGYGTVLFLDKKKKKDFIQLSPEGISFIRQGESGFISWDSIKEIISRSHVSGVDYMIKANGVALIFNKEIEPADLPPQNILKRFLFDYKYGKQLLEQIRQVVPNVHYHSGI